MMPQAFAAQAQLLSVDQVAVLITGGATLLVAGDEMLLQKLPRGRWIGGSIPYFMTESGGLISREQLFVHQLPSVVTEVKICNYDIDRLHRSLADAPDNGFSVLLLPAGSEVHASYACNAPSYEDMFLKPIIGWVTGVHLDDLDQIKPKVFNGEQGLASEQEAVILHARLPDTLTASIGIVNLFTQGTGDTFVFPETGFQAQDCMINGRQQNLADYLLDGKIDTRLPLVADYYGAMINVSFQNVDPTHRLVNFYAPVFEGIEYRLAEPVPDYVNSFQAALPRNLTDVVFSCNCILNFLYSELEGKQTDALFGPMTFGEVAYQLLNQTLVYLRLDGCGPSS
jgi:hypothetical protein